MNKALLEQLKKLCDEGEKATNNREIELWSSKTSSFLKTAISSDEQIAFLGLTSFMDEWVQHSLRVGHMQGLIAKGEADLSSKISSDIAKNAEVQQSFTNSNKVFVVHGHDNEAKESTARFLQKLDLQPIILHEQASFGRTVIEKFETYASDIAFAVVLLTPDDVGSPVSSPQNLKPRARQNVVMELGYFMGKLGRVRVCALFKGGVELPSDYQGVVYIEMDGAGAWKTKLAQEFVQAKLPINLNGLVCG